eukprot:CAMPEP_0113483446 /NCGR_PEP_ID=MMETSP0014_2-20120614/23437_1 /TAXON_ID=2857 /ORGANISM="Nitzschia sp." /LENGTH=356 /DNA_ID=CAMNT_0000376991 /DNA_START=375 /DNA_END=1445 /DNA_ORIENTATION=+ /assembly_acc=CAM_ASM_000159
MTAATATAVPTTALNSSASASASSTTNSKGGNTKVYTTASGSVVPPEKIIDGKAIAATIRKELQAEIDGRKLEGLTVPGLAVVLVGSRRDSQTYVNMKKKACDQVGIASFGYDFDAGVSQQTLLDTVQELNGRDDVHGILIQLPLPSHIDEDVILQAVTPSKDVDGLHPENVARLALTGTHGGKQGYWKQLQSIPFSVPCTPLGCLELLDRSGVDIEGKKAAVIGRSNLVGLPVSFLLLHRNATVTIVHSRTQNIEDEVSRADIVIAAVGRAKIVKDTWLKDGAVVIDVGINSIELPPEQVPEGKKPYKLVGDVDFDLCADKCSKITPVPGGVGPMTIAMLLRNTLNACKRADATA